MLLEPRQGLLQHSVAIQTRNGVSVLETPVEQAHHFIVLLHQLGGYGTQQCLPHHSRPAALNSIRNHQKVV
jgi:hypothetical protein